MGAGISLTEFGTGKGIGTLRLRYMNQIRTARSILMPAIASLRLYELTSKMNKEKY